MNKSFTHSLCLALFLTTVSPMAASDTSIDTLKLMAVAAKAGAKASLRAGLCVGASLGVLGTLYYYLFYETEADALKKIVKVCETVQKAHDDISLAYTQELSIIQNATAETDVIFSELNNIIHPQFTNKPLYHYVHRLNNDARKIYNPSYWWSCPALNTLTQAKSDLNKLIVAVNNLQHNKDEQTRLLAQCAATLENIGQLEISLKALYNNLTIIRDHITSSPQYTLQLQQARIEDLENRVNHMYYSHPTVYIHSYTPKACAAKAPVIVNNYEVNVTYEEKTVTPITSTSAEPVTTPTIPSSTATNVAPEITFNAQEWCDRTDPFNS